jgi:hypothetical protein
MLYAEAITLREDTDAAVLEISEEALDADQLIPSGDFITVSVPTPVHTKKEPFQEIPNGYVTNPTAEVAADHVIAS